MTIIKRSALVMHSAHRMYDLVNDVSSYPAFMDGCIGVEIFEHTDVSMLARLDLKKAGVKLSLMTRNNLDKPNSVHMTLEDGPFKSFRGDWKFRPLTESACKVELEMEFEFNSAAISFATSKLFSGMANTLVESVCRRADELNL